MTEEFEDVPLASATVTETNNDDDDDDDGFYYEQTLPSACVVEEPFDNFDANEHDELLAQIARDEKHDEEKRAAANGLKSTAPTIAPAATKRQRSQSAKPRKRAAKETSAGMTKAKKMYAKQLRAVTRDADKIIETVMSGNESEDVRKLRVESQHAHQRALAEMRELKKLLEAGTRTKEAVKLYAELTAKIRKLNQLQKENNTKTTTAADAMNDMILGDCVEIIADQSTTISKLHERVNKLVELYCKMTAKCEAATRRSFDSSSQFTQRSAPATTSTSTGLLLSAAPDTNNQMIAAPQSSSSTSSTTNTSSLFSVRTGNGYYDLTTPSAPQVVRGRPGATYIPFSVARRKGSAQQLAQSDSIARAHNVQRWAKLAKKKRAFGELIIALPHMNGDDALAEHKLLDAPESASLARITGGAAKGARKPKKPKAIAAAPS